ncbi:MAG: hypothetical protein JO218_13370 [Burkholderiales bacterium]|nr:hypothetical protein [Burkholderiales bacterium]
MRRTCKLVLIAGLAIRTLALDVPVSGNLEATRIGTSDAWTFHQRNETNQDALVQFEAVTDHLVGGGVGIEVTPGKVDHIVRLDRQKYPIRVDAVVASDTCMYDPIMAPHGLAPPPTCSSIIKVGDSWSRFEKTPEGSVKFTYEFRAWENISVAAGTFKAARILQIPTETYKSQANTDKLDSLQINTGRRCQYWYASSAKIVVKSICEDKGEDGTVKRYWDNELMTYEVH